MNQHQSKRVKSILILEDDIFQANAMRKKLEKNGYEVIDTVYSGVAAINSVKRKMPDIVLLDIQLDGQDINGIDVGEAIHLINEDIIIIYVTAFGTEDNFVKALNTNPHAFIEKPYNLKKLSREIEMAVNRAISKAELPIQVSVGQEEKNLPKRFSILHFPDFLLINEGKNGYTRVAMHDVLYLESDNVWTDIHTRTRKICLSIGLGTFEKELDYKEFFRTHKSYIVNLRNVTQVKVQAAGGHVIIDNNHIPVARARVKAFWQAWNNLFK